MPTVVNLSVAVVAAVAEKIRSYSIHISQQQRQQKKVNRMKRIASITKKDVIQENTFHFPLV